MRGFARRRRPFYFSSTRFFQLDESTCFLPPNTKSGNDTWYHIRTRTQCAASDFFIFNFNCRRPTIVELQVPSANVCCRAVCCTQRRQCSLIERTVCAGGCFAFFVPFVAPTASLPFGPGYKLRSRFFVQRHSVLISCARLPPPPLVVFSPLRHSLALTCAHLFVGGTKTQFICKTRNRPSSRSANKRLGALSGAASPLPFFFLIIFFSGVPLSFMSSFGIFSFASFVCCGGIPAGGWRAFWPICALLPDMPPQHNILIVTVIREPSLTTGATAEGATPIFTAPFAPLGSGRWLCTSLKIGRQVFGFRS